MQGDVCGGGWGLERRCIIHSLDVTVTALLKFLFLLHSWMPPMYVKQRSSCIESYG